MDQKIIDAMTFSVEESDMKLDVFFYNETTGNTLCFSRSYGDRMRGIILLSSIDDQTLLEISIKKWQTIVDYLDDLRSKKALKSKAFLLKDNGSSTCALCMKYFLDADCVGCPVYHYTGFEGCLFTPYENFVLADTNTEKLKYAKAELRFLKSRRKYYEQDIGEE